VTNQLKPISEPFAPEIEAALLQYSRIDGYLLSLFRTFANSLMFLKKGVPNLLDKDSPLSLRAREIVILRVTANNNCEYEWGVHAAALSEAAALNQEQVSNTKCAEISPSLWSPEESNLLRAIDDLCLDGKISTDTLVHFEANWTLEQQLEIFALCGTYHTLSFVANSARLANEPFGATFQDG
jgi:alkylhydroperoxidase family enzyme